MVKGITSIHAVLNSDMLFAPLQEVQCNVAYGCCTSCSMMEYRQYIFCKMSNWSSKQSSQHVGFCSEIDLADSSIVISKGD